MKLFEKGLFDADAQSGRDSQRKSKGVSQALLCGFSAPLHLCVKMGGFTNSLRRQNCYFFSKTSVYEKKLPNRRLSRKCA
jgi:hypothetical protein